MYEYLDRRYAYALYEIAEEKGRIEEYIGELRMVCNLIENDKEFVEVIKHPQISTKNKKNTFINIFKGNIDEDLLSFLLVLIEKDRILFLREKLKEYEKIVLEKNDIVTGILKTTNHLTQEQYNLLIEKLEKRYKKIVLLTEVIDPKIIGGIYVKVNDEVMDGTIKLRLDMMKKMMLGSM